MNSLPQTLELRSFPVSKKHYQKNVSYKQYKTAALPSPSPEKSRHRSTHPSRQKKHKNKKAAADPHSQSLLAAAAVEAEGGRILWHDLPLKLAMNLLSNTTEGTVLDAVSSGGVTKSWRPQLNKCKSSPATVLPQLQLFPHDQLASKSTVPHRGSYNYPFRSANQEGHVRWLAGRYDGCFFHHRNKPKLVGVSKGMAWATGRIPDRLRYYLLTIETERWGWGEPPFWDQDYGYLRRIYTEDAVVIVLTGLPVPAFAYYRSVNQRRHAWKKQDSPIIDPNCSGVDRSMTLHSGIWMRGKLYALSLQGTLVVIEPESSNSSSETSSCRVGSMGEQRVVPCAPCKHFREIMVESEGEVLLVFLVFMKSIDSVDGLEVYRLDIEKLEWVRLYDLEGRVLFFGINCCVSVSVAEAEAEGLGCRRNCVYFKHNYWAAWFEYDMATGTVNHLG